MSLTYQITLLDPTDQRFGDCFAIRALGKPCSRQPCSGSQIARYRLTALNPATGEVIRTSPACTNHAAWLAHQVGLAFPINSKAAA